MITRKTTVSTLSSLFLVLVLALALGGPCMALEMKLIGQIESLYRNRVSMRVLEVVSPTGTGTSEVPISVGQRVSFNLPRSEAKKNKRPIEFGNVIETELEGNVATEYEQTEGVNEGDAPLGADKAAGMIWTARRVERVKNQGKYLDPEKEGEKKGKGKGKGRKGRDKKDKEPPEIWTQEEAVKGLVSLKNLHLYIREDNLRPRDQGLKVIQPEWSEKLRPFAGQRVVLYGTTHRVSVASGSIEILNIMKISPADTSRKK